jgi:hypothetical protein
MSSCYDYNNNILFGSLNLRSPHNIISVIGFSLSMTKVESNFFKKYDNI